MKKTPVVQVSAEAYNAFIAGLELKSVRLSHAEIHAPSLPERRPLEPRFNMESGEYVHGDNEVTIRVGLTFKGQYEDEDDPAVRVLATYELIYAAEERMTDAIFREFHTRNLRVNIWPYFRELVHTSLARVNWPVFVLPVFKTFPTSPREQLTEPSQ